MAIAQAHATPVVIGIEELDPPLADALGARAPSYRLPGLALTPGRLTRDALGAATDGTFALLVVAGLITRDICIGETVAAEILGAGDFVTAAAEGHDVLAIRNTWSVAAPARVAVLDTRLVEAFRASPELAVRFVTMSTSQLARTTVHRSIVQLPRVEDRILALFRLLAERWGDVGPAGIVVPLTLTHQAIGRLVGARRPTVSLGLRVLAEDGSLVRRDDGSWVLAAADRARPAAPAPTSAHLVAPHVAETMQRPARAARFDIDIDALRRRTAELAEEFAEQVRSHAEALDHYRATREALTIRREAASSRRPPPA